VKENKKYIIVGIVTTLILALGFSLAYFAPIIRGEGKKITVRTGSLNIVFTDSTEITEEEITPGWSTSKTFTVENESNTPYYYNINLKDVINTFVTEGFLQYKITSTNGYNMEEYKPITKESFQVLEEGIKISGLETQEYTIYFRYVDSPDVDQSADMNKEFSGYLSITEGQYNRFNKGTLGYQLIKDNPTILERTDFDNPFTEENTATLYKATGNETEDGSDVYYFAGNALNNWVKFGKDQDDADLYWRIIRTNEDGGVRLLYIGPDPATTSAFIKIDGVYMSGKNTTDVRYAYGASDPKFGGYMYGNTGTLDDNRTNNYSAPIKQVTDSWYSKTLKVNTDINGQTYDTYISKTAIYCNDRSSANDLNIIEFGAQYRIEKNKRPSYKCGVDQNGNLFTTADIADKFSASTKSGGNGQLQYPIAQITADELAYAGGVQSKASHSWYYYNSINESVVGEEPWWTMTPSIFNTNMYVFTVNGSNNSGKFLAWYVYDANPGIRPVLSLKSCVKYVSGDGSSASPYEVTVDSTCVESEN